MLNVLARRKPIQVRSAPTGRRLYAVGDVHGRLDALDVLLAAIRADMVQDALRPVLVMLGDYVDRGPSSRQVLDRLLQLEGDPGLETVFIRGNHDEMMRRFAGEPAVGPDWCDFGGGETLRSYGVSPPPPGSEAGEWLGVQHAFKSAVPAEHLMFLDALPSWVEYGDYFFAHAGVRPGVKLCAQSPEDLMWIREPFLDGSTLFEKVVVHGHTPSANPFVSERRIGLDTGAFATGRLTAVVLEGAGRRLIQARISTGGATVEHLEAAATTEPRRARR